jgi:flagellar motor switch protein FliG
MAGASGPFKERVFDRLPYREARALRRQITELGAIRLRDIEVAQTRMAELACDLESDEFASRSSYCDIAAA